MVSCVHSCAIFCQITFIFIDAFVWKCKINVELVLYVCQAVIFRPAIYHPNVDPESGRLDVTRVFPKWR